MQERVISDEQFEQIRIEEDEIAKKLERDFSIKRKVTDLIWKLEIKKSLETISFEAFFSLLQIYRLIITHWLLSHDNKLILFSLSIDVQIIVLGVMLFLQIKDLESICKISNTNFAFSDTFSTDNEDVAQPDDNNKNSINFFIIIFSFHNHPQFYMLSLLIFFYAQE